MDNLRKPSLAKNTLLFIMMMSKDVLLFLTFYYLNFYLIIGFLLLNFYWSHPLINLILYLIVCGKLNLTLYNNHLVYSGDGELAKYFQLKRDALIHLFRPKQVVDYDYDKLREVERPKRIYLLLFILYLFIKLVDMKSMNYELFVGADFNSTQDFLEYETSEIIISLLKDPLTLFGATFGFIFQELFNNLNRYFIGDLIMILFLVKYNYGYWKYLSFHQFKFDQAAESVQDQS